VGNSGYTHALFYALVVFLLKWLQIKKDMDIRNKGLAKQNTANQRALNHKKERV